MESLTEKLLRFNRLRLPESLAAVAQPTSLAASENRADPCFTPGTIGAVDQVIGDKLNLLGHLVHNRGWVIVAHTLQQLQEVARWQTAHCDLALASFNRK